MKLTDEQIEEIRVSQEFDKWGIQEGAFKYVARAIEAAVQAQGEAVGINGLTEAETAATASVMWIVAPEAKQEPVCLLCHGKGEYEMFSAHLPGQPEPERRMVKCKQCTHPAPVNTALLERIKGLEQAVDVALEALENSAVKHPQQIPQRDAALNLLKEVRREAT